MLRTGMTLFYHIETGPRALIGQSNGPFRPDLSGTKVSIFVVMVIMVRGPLLSVISQHGLVRIPSRRCLEGSSPQG